MSMTSLFIDIIYHNAKYTQTMSSNIYILKGFRGPTIRDQLIMLKMFINI